MLARSHHNNGRDKGEEWDHSEKSTKDTDSNGGVDIHEGCNHRLNITPKLDCQNPTIPPARWSNAELLRGAWTEVTSSSTSVMYVVMNIPAYSRYDSVE